MKCGKDNNGLNHINAPTRGQYHCYPGDNWRFYSDAGQALAYWSGLQVCNEEVYPVQVVETFNVLGDTWNDFICVWKRVDNKETSIVVHNDILDNIGILEKSIIKKGLQTRKHVKNNILYWLLYYSIKIYSE